MSWNDFFQFVMFFSLAPAIAVYYFLLNILPYSKGNSIVFQQIIDITTLLGTLDQLDFIASKIYNNCDYSNKGYISFRHFLSFVTKSTNMWKPLYSFRLAVIEKFFDKSILYSILNRKMVILSIKKYKFMHNGKFPPEPCCQRVKHILENRPSNYQFDYECIEKDVECNFTIATINYINRFNDHFIRDFTGSFSKYMNTISKDYDNLFLHIDQCYMRFNGPMIKSPRQSSINNTGSVVSARNRAGTDLDLLSNNGLPLILGTNPTNNNNNNRNTGNKASFSQALSQRSSMREPRASILKSPANHVKGRESNSLLVSPFATSIRHLKLPERASGNLTDENSFVITSPLHNYNNSRGMNGGNGGNGNRRIRTPPMRSNNNIETGSGNGGNNLVNCSGGISEEDETGLHENGHNVKIKNCEDSKSSKGKIELSNLQDVNIINKSKTVNSVDSIKKNKVVPLEDIKTPKTT